MPCYICYNSNYSNKSSYSYNHKNNYQYNHSNFSFISNFLISIVIQRPITAPKLLCNTSSSSHRPLQLTNWSNSIATLSTTAKITPRHFHRQPTKTPTGINIITFAITWFLCVSHAFHDQNNSSCKCSPSKGVLIRIVSVKIRNEYPISIPR